MFDETLLNNSVAETFCNKTALWTSPMGSTEILVMFDIEPTYDADGVINIGDGAYSAGCVDVTAAAMRRGHTLEIEGDEYKVLDTQKDGNGWITIALDKL